MHRAAAATMPTTMPVVLLDSRITSAEPGYGSLPPARVGLAVGKRGENTHTHSDYRVPGMLTVTV